MLLFCGGGKDSLVAARVLEEAGVPYASYAYSHSTYGRPEPQHALIDGLLDHLTPTERLRHWVFDDLLDVPVERLAPELGVRAVTAAETPAALFGALPLALSRGLQRRSSSPTSAAPTSGTSCGTAPARRSTTSGASRWTRNGGSRDYVREELVAGVAYASLLKPVHDVLIFRRAPRVARRRPCHPLVQRRQALVPPVREVRLRVARLPGVPPRGDHASDLR